MRRIGLMPGWRTWCCHFGEKRGAGELKSLHGCERNALLLEFQLNAAAQFSRYFILARGSGAYLQADDGSGAIDALYAEYSWAVDECLRPGRIVAHLGGGRFQSNQRFFECGIGRQGDIDEGLRPIAAEVGYSADVAVGDGDQRAAGITQYRAAQGDVLNAPDAVSDLNSVADDVLILQHNVKTGDDVAYQILRAKTDCEAGESGERGHGSNVDAKLRHARQNCHGPHDFAASAVQHSRDSARLLLAAQRDAG